VRARARLVVDCDPRGRSVVRELRSEVPIVLRRSRDAVYLVGGAAGPLGGDDLRLDVVVAPGARLAIRSAAASVALPGPTGARSRFEVQAEVGARAFLDWAPGPVVATARCGHDVLSRIIADADGCVRWREELVAGRTGEEAGSVTARLVIDVDGRPVLRHELRIGAGAPGWDGPAVLDGARAVGSLALLGLAPAARRAQNGTARTRVLELEHGGVLVTSVGTPASVSSALLGRVDQAGVTL